MTEFSGDEKSLNEAMLIVEHEKLAREIKCREEIEAALNKYNCFIDSAFLVSINKIEPIIKVVSK